MAATRLMALHIVRDRTLAESLKERMDYTEDELKTEQKRYISTHEATTIYLRVTLLTDI